MRELQSVAGLKIHDGGRMWFFLGKNKARDLIPY